MTGEVMSKIIEVVSKTNNKMDKPDYARYISIHLKQLLLFVITQAKHTSNVFW